MFIQGKLKEVKQEAWQDFSFEKKTQLFVSSASQKLLKNILSLCKDYPVMLLMSLGWDLGLSAVYVPIMQVKNDFFAMQFLSLWVHDTLSLKTDLLLPLHFLSPFGLTCFHCGLNVLPSGSETSRWHITHFS